VPAGEKRQHSRILIGSGGLETPGGKSAERLSSSFLCFRQFGLYYIIYIISVCSCLMGLKISMYNNFFV
jgi:hypothetical protein